MVLSFLMLFGLFIQAYIMESSFGMLMALVNFSLLFSFLASKNASTIVYNFLLVIGIILTIFILNGFSLSFYFKLVEYVIDQVIPNSTLNYFKLIKGTELAEQALARQVLKVCMEYFLKND